MDRHSIDGRVRLWSRAGIVVAIAAVFAVGALVRTDSAAGQAQPPTVVAAAVGSLPTTTVAPDVRSLLGGDYSGMVHPAVAGIIAAALP